MDTRNGEGGTRNNKDSSRGASTAVLFRIPRFAFALAVCACSPVTVRPAFAPLPEALVATINAPPARVAAAAAEWLAGEGLTVVHSSPRDGYVETAWYDTHTKATHGGSGDVPDLAATVKLRCWADPDVPGRTRLTVEPVYRPRYDPSRTERDLEAAVPESHDGHRVAQRLLEALKQKYGSSS
jgi:hypothetical protein